MGLKFDMKLGEFPLSVPCDPDLVRNTLETVRTQVDVPSCSHYSSYVVAAR